MEVLWISLFSQVIHSIFLAIPRPELIWLWGDAIAVGDPWYATSLGHVWGSHQKNGSLKDKGLSLVRVKVIDPQAGSIPLECKGITPRQAKVWCAKKIHSQQGEISTRRLIDLLGFLNLPKRQINDRLMTSQCRCRKAISLKVNWPTRLLQIFLPFVL